MLLDRFGRGGQFCNACNNKLNRQQQQSGGAVTSRPPPLRMRDVLRAHTLPPLPQCDSLKDALVSRRAEIGQILAEELASYG